MFFWDFYTPIDYKHENIEYPCRIGVMRRNSKIESIFCKYPYNDITTMSKILIKNYNNVRVVSKLMKKGNIYSLPFEYEELVLGLSYPSFPVDPKSVISANIEGFLKLSKDCHCYYVFLFQSKEWQVSTVKDNFYWAHAPELFVPLKGFYK